MRRFRILRATLLAPWVAPVLILLEPTSGDYVGVKVLVAVVALFFSVAFTVLVGIPLFKLLEYFGRLSLVTLGLAGLLTGPVLLLVALSVFGGRPVDAEFVQVLVGSLFGAATALAFGAAAGVGLRATTPHPSRRTES